MTVTQSHMAKYLIASLLTLGITSLSVAEEQEVVDRELAIEAMNWAHRNFSHATLSSRDTISISVLNE